MKLSVIVPIYNVEQYVEECLDSLLHQGLSAAEYEIICIDDGSTDQSGEIAVAYEKKYQQVRVIRQENGGLGRARNAGMEVATGKYLCFVDSDDYLDHGVLGRLYDLAVQYDLDKLMFGYQSFRDGTEEYVHKTEIQIREEEIVFFPDALQMDCSEMVPDWKIVWNYLIRLSVIREYELHFMEGALFEDQEFNYWLNHCAGRSGYIDRKWYHYRKRSTSIVHTFRNDTQFPRYIRGRCKLSLHHKNVLEAYMAGKPPRLRIPVTKEELEKRLYCETRGILSQMIRKGDRTVFETTLDVLISNGLYPYPMRLYRLGIDKRFQRLLIDVASVPYPAQWYLRLCMACRCLPKEWKERFLPLEVRVWYSYHRRPYTDLAVPLKKYILIDFENHGNLGDNAIGLSEIDLVRRHISDELSVFYLKDFFQNIKYIRAHTTKDHVFLLTGGGNFGILYPYMDFVRAVVCTLFRHNRVVMFPQTVDFGDPARAGSRKWLRELRRIFSAHPDLTLCAREQRSYRFLQKYFSGNRVLLVPDMVLRYPCQIPCTGYRNRQAVFCFRSDKEKRIPDQTVGHLKQILLDREIPVIRVDTFRPKTTMESLEESRKAVEEMIGQFAGAGLVLTDRLHGMIFSYLARTPCIVFPGCNHKIRGVFEWVRQCGYVFYAADEEAGIRILKRLLRSDLRCVPVRTGPMDDRIFEELIHAIRGNR